MNKLSSTLTFSSIVGSLPSLKEQLNPKNFPKYTIPMTYYESYFNILSMKKYPLVQATIKAAKEGKIKIRNVEGRDSTWILIDLYDIILHLFTKEERANYDLDSLYMDIPQLDI